MKNANKNYSKLKVTSFDKIIVLSNKLFNFKILNSIIGVMA